MFAGDAFYGKVDHVPGMFYVTTRFLHYMWIPVVPRESYLVRDDNSGVAVRIPLRWKSILLAWSRTCLFILAMTLMAGGIAFVRMEPQHGKTHPVVIGLVQWGIVLGLGAVYLFTYCFCRASPHRARELGARLDIPHAELDVRYVSQDATTAPPPSREVITEIAGNVREMSANSFEAAGEAAGEVMSMTVLVGVSLLVACIGMAVGTGVLYVVTKVAGESRLLLWSTMLICAGAPLLLVVRRQQRSAPRDSFLGESRGMWLAVCSGAWVLGVALSIWFFL